MKRIITEEVPPPLIPDHQQPVTNEKLNALMDYLALDEFDLQLFFYTSFSNILLRLFNHSVSIDLQGRSTRNHLRRHEVLLAYYDSKKILAG